MTMFKIDVWWTNISHLGKRKIIFKMDFSGDMLVSRRVDVWWTLAGSSPTPFFSRFWPLKKQRKKITKAAWMWLQALGEDIHGQRKRFNLGNTRNQSRISRLKSNHKTPWMSLSPCLEDQVYLPLWGTAGLGYRHASVSISAQDKFVITK